jgi:hypothetical protein
MFGTGFFISWIYYQGSASLTLFHAKRYKTITDDTKTRILDTPK